MDENVYAGREQTEAKHFLLRHYLQALAAKVLRFSDITYVDGFSGPWQSKTEDFADSSFMIAIQALRGAQQRDFEATGKRRLIRCFFSEKDAAAFSLLSAAVERFHAPNERFEIQTYCGKFEDAVAPIERFIGNSFPLIFIDPTGWTGYPFEKIKPLFARRKCEVLINFMYEFVNRFVSSDDEDTISSLDPILGGPGWRERLDTSMSRGLAVEKLFRQSLRAAGDFKFVVSTKIDKATAERPHFFIAYGTKDRAGLIQFRQSEYDSLRVHAKNRANAKERMAAEKAQIDDLFRGHHAEVKEASIDDLVREQKSLGTAELLAWLPGQGRATFGEVVERLLQTRMLRETNVKDICVDLAKSGVIENTWGAGGRKPQDGSLIVLASTA